MAKNEVRTKILVRNDSLNNWESSSLVLGQGEVAWANDAGKFKIGDGSKTWSQISSYYTDFAAVQAAINAAVKDLSRTEVYQAEIEKGANKVAALQAVAENPVKGDIGIVKEAITGDLKEYTAYVYNGSAWTAMDGNYDADNVYFSKDIVITAPLGVHKIGASGSATLEATGKNITSFMQYLGAEEKDPTITQPSVSISLTNAGAKEVGSSITPAYKVTFNAGNYEFGPATGVTAEYAVSDTASHTASTAEGSFDAFTVEDATSYKVSVTATYTNGAVPETNLQAKKPELAIKAGSKSATSSAVTGFRGWFYGYKTDNTINPETMTSAQVRALGAARNGSFATSVTTNKMQQMFFAAPKGLVKNIQVANSKTTAPQVVTKRSAELMVEGANSYQAVAYDLFYVNNAAAEGGDTTFTVTVTK